MKLGSVLNLLSIVLGSPSRRGETIVLSCDGERLALPVTPHQIDSTMGQNNRTVNIAARGEVLIFGLPKLQTVSFESFFPHPDHEYPFVVGDYKQPAECVQLLKKWKELRQPVRVIIPSLDINLMMAIQEFNPSKRDNTGDIYYSLQLAEYPELVTPSANNPNQVNTTTGLRGRPDAGVRGTQATMVTKAADVLDVAKKAYGKYQHWRRVAESNNLKTLAINNADKLRKLVIKE
ncbi:hypothetical protein [Veillonella magna]|uniref:Uncharacterized protein n=1 Tax=Veillonella magna TaxID=464322 RepID=A0ABS2GG60_9FIRM|nr:hypothetical protein [Veillonella magna]MBM6824785.1 hypothetical protein [Veillonella magna]MBM6913136.1 hypothetical protein [Veillonella magna]